MENIKLIDLIDLEALQRIQDGFSKYTGMAALTTDVRGVPLTKGSGFTRFCYELTRKSEIACKNCERCDSEGAIRTLQRGKATAYVCHAGLMDFAAPILVEGEMIGSFIGGQVRVESTDENYIINKAKEYGIDPEEYLKASRETSLLASKDVEKAAEFIEEIASALSLMAYKSYLELNESNRMGRIAKSQADYVMNMSMNLENIMNRWIYSIDNNISKTINEDIHDLLTAIQNEGFEVKNNIKETLNFIKMSANEVEISESVYTLEQLMTMASDSVNDIVSMKITSADRSKLFGDVVVIAQMVNRIVKKISDEKTLGTVEVEFSTKLNHYATYLNILIREKKIQYTDEYIDKVKKMFQNKNPENLNVRDEMSLWLSLEGMMLDSMSGTIDVNKEGEDLITRICIPQIGLQE